MQVYVMCPFCSRVFDTMDEPHVVLRVDRTVRTAHLKCVPESVPAEQPAGTVKPNGAEPSVTTS